MQELTEQQKKRFATVERIKKLIRKHKKIWMSELARKMGMSRSGVVYYIYGIQYSDGRKFGGWLEHEINVVATEGRNKLLKLK